MALELKKGAVIDLAEKRNGNGQNGEWFFVPFKAEKGYDRITIWATNPEEAKYFTGSAVIEEIESVSLSNTRDRNDQTKWYKQYNANCKLGGSNGNKATGNKGLSAFDSMMGANDGFMSIPSGNDDGLPFN